VSDETVLAELIARYPTVPQRSIAQCVADARAAVEYATVADEEQPELVARLARAHVEELAAHYPG
jgi:hypothetical protein